MLNAYHKVQLHKTIDTTSCKIYCLLKHKHMKGIPAACEIPFQLEISNTEYLYYFQHSCFQENNKNFTLFTS